MNDRPDACNRWTGTAVFSEDRKYRYLLRRKYVGEKPMFPTENHGKTICWVMLNPSTADEKVNDPTIAKCLTTSRAWGYHDVTIVNIFAYRATKPSNMMKFAKEGGDPIGPLNRRFLREEILSADTVICAWGAGGSFQGREADIIKGLGKTGTKAWCLGFTKEKAPRHPLYVSKKEKLYPFPNREAGEREG